MRGEHQLSAAGGQQWPAVCLATELTANKANTAIVYLCLCGHSQNGLPHMSEGLLHKLPHAVHLPCRYDEILWLLLLQHQPHGLKETETDGEVKPLRHHKDSSVLHTGHCPTLSWQAGSEPATSEQGIRPYLCPDVTAGAHGTNTVGKEDRAVP